MAEPNNHVTAADSCLQSLVDDRSDRSTVFVGNLPHKMTSAQTDSPISRLTDDSLIHIFEYLTPLEVLNIEGVCKQWRRCALAAARQKKCMTLTRQCPSVTSIQGQGFCELMSRCCNLVSLDISSVVMLLRNIDPLKIIATFGKHIERLDVSGVASNNRSLGFLARECTHLKSLTVKNCSRISERGFRYLFKYCKHLEHLDCTGNSGFTGKCLAHATSAFKSLHASDCIRLTNKGMMHLFKKCPLMRTLQLEKCPQLAFQTISLLAKSLPCLKILYLGYSQYLQRPANSAYHFVQHLVNPGIIVELKLFNCGLLDENLQMICTSCPLLSFLDISCNILTDASVIQLASLKYLQYLSACEQYDITDVSLLNVAKQGKLRKLLVQYCFRLTDRLMKIVAENCLQLEELDIAGIPSISTVSLSCFRESCLRREITSQLHIYTADNGFDYCAPHEHSNPPNLYIYEIYRPLYLVHRGDNQDVARVGNPVVPNPNHQNQVQVLPADLVDFDDDSDDDFDCSDDCLADEFLDNDDVLAQERWNLS